MSNLKEKKSAREVLQKYTNGIREFHKFDLRNQSFYKEDLGIQESPDLSKADFTDCNLRGANFTGCNLTKANFTRCNLRGTIFKEAKLQEAKFHHVKAGSQNSQIEYTLFFISLLVVTFTSIGVIFFLVNLRQAELDVIQNYSADFLLLTFLVPIGYCTHLLATGTKMAYGFWVGGILVFLLKTIDEPLSGFCGNLIFLVMALTLVNPIKQFWKIKVKLSWDFVINNFLLYWLRSNTLRWNYLPKLLLNVGNCFLFLLLSLFAIIAIIISFFPLESDLLGEINSDFLFWISLAFSLPAILSLFFFFATYAILFDSNNVETYAKIFKNFVFILLPVSAFYFYYYSIIEFYLDFSYIFGNIPVLSQFFSFLQNPLLIFVSLTVIIWLIISLSLRAQNIIRNFILAISLILFWGSLVYLTMSSKSLSDNNIDNFLLSLFIDFSHLCLLSSSVLLAFNFLTLQFESKDPAKILATWYFGALFVPLLLMHIKSSEISFQFNFNKLLNLFGNTSFIIPLSLWFIFLLSVSVPSIHNLPNKLVVWSKKRKLLPAIHNLLDKLVIWFGNDFYKLYSSTFFRGYLFFSVSIIIVIYFSNWFTYGYSDISYFLELFEDFPLSIILLLLLLLLFVLTLLSAILWVLLLPVKKVISKSKSSERKSKIKSKYSGFRALVVFIKAFGSTNFEGAELQKADFTEAQLDGVNFRRAKIKGVIWSGATGLDGSAVGNTYLKYPKVRNWVSSEKKVR